MRRRTGAHAHTPGTPTATSTYADERGRPFVELVARIGDDAPATVVDLGCGPGNLTALLAERWPAAEVPRASTQPRDDRRGPRDRPRDRLRGRRRAGLAAGRARRRPRLQRHPAVGARPPRPAARRCWPRSGPAAGSPSRCRATSTSPATPSAPSSPPTPPYDAHTAWRRGAVRARRRRPTSRCCTGLGCDVDAWETTYLHVLHRRGPGVHLGQRHRRPAHAPGAARRPPPGVRGGVQGAAARGLPRDRRHGSCCRSGGSSWSRRTPR